MTYARALQIRRLACVLPLESIVLETDAPDQPVAGAVRGEPGDLVTVIRHAAAARGVEADRLGAETMDNALTLFAVRCGG